MDRYGRVVTPVVARHTCDICGTRLSQSTISTKRPARAIHICGNCAAALAFEISLHLPDDVVDKMHEALVGANQKENQKEKKENERSEQASAERDAVKTVEFESYTNAELKALCDQAGIEYRNNTARNKLIEMLENHSGD